jgi:molecular chaperone GrpE
MSTLLALSATAVLALTSSSFRMGPLPMQRIAVSSHQPAARSIAAVHLTRARVVSMAADAEGSDGAATNEDATASEIVEDEAPAAEAEVVEEQEEEEDLLSSPAFLKQKLNVLKAELEKIEQDTADLRAEAEVQREEWSSKRLRLQTDLENYQARHKAQILDM